MSFWDWFKMTPRAVDTGLRVVEKAADGIIAGIDKAIYTPEEKAIALQKATETIIALWKAAASENSEQSKARRDIAFMVLKIYFSLMLIGVAVYGFNAEYAQFIFGVVKEVSIMVAGIQFIYFGPHQIQKLLNKE
uniref:Holin n=1 Tax=viral metagenome TaxID=1070528 RepID=A0A6M3LTN8_9ZZZZ